jgi:hypothetical protein
MEIKDRRGRGGRGRGRGRGEGEGEGEEREGIPECHHAAVQVLVMCSGFASHPKCMVSLPHILMERKGQMGK